MSVAIRPARPGEAPLVLAFVRELAAYEKLSHQVEATAAALDLALFGPAPRLFCAIAEWDGEPAGFALWFSNFSSFRGRHGVYLEDLFVRPAHRRHGVGRALLRHLARRCVDEGWSRFEWSVLAWNRNAIAFYEAHGAVLMQDWRICRVEGSALAHLAEEQPAGKT